MLSRSLAFCCVALLFGATPAAASTLAPESRLMGLQNASDCASASGPTCIADADTDSIAWPTPILKAAISSGLHVSLVVIKTAAPKETPGADWHSQPPKSHIPPGTWGFWPPQAIFDGAGGVPAQFAMVPLVPALHLALLTLLTLVPVFRWRAFRRRLSQTSRTRSNA